MFIVFALHIRIDITLTYDITYQTSNSLLKTLMGKIMIRAFELFLHNITSYPKCFEFKKYPANHKWILRSNSNSNRRIIFFLNRIQTIVKRSSKAL